MDGLLILDKPAGCTSHDVVLNVRKALNIRKVGHAGTLDPDATGVLLVAIGQATRLFPILSGHDKTYEGTIRFGYSTDTYDASGRPTSAESTTFPSEEKLRAALRAFLGEILQAPPPYSAKKVGGKPGYVLARSKREFVLKPARVVIRALTLKSYLPPYGEFEMTCSSGTYVRSVAHDLGTSLGCGAHLLSLRRLSVGPFDVRDALTLERLEESIRAGRSTDLLVPLERLLPEIPAVTVLGEAVDRVKNGSLVTASHLASGGAELSGGPAPVVWQILDPSGSLLAVANRIPESGALHPFLVIHR